jgi:hypothetical protein
MTLIMPTQEICACCGDECKVSVLISTNARGLPDLDSRPPPMQRNTVFNWLHECRGCGYCAPDLGEALPGTAEIVRGDDFQSKVPPRFLDDNPRPLFKATGVPGAALRFERWALLCAAQGDNPAIVKAYIHAAWAADDAGRDDHAARFRTEAASRLQALLDRGADPHAQRGFSALLLADLWRRAGAWDRAVAATRRGLALCAADAIARALSYELELIVARDAANRKFPPARAGRNRA